MNHLLAQSGSGLALSQLAGLGVAIAVTVLFVILAILRWRPDYVRVDVTAQSMRIKELTAEITQQKGQIALLSQLLVSAEARALGAEERARESEIRMVLLEDRLAVLREQLERNNVIDKPTLNELAATPVLVAIGDDKILELDLAAFRAVETDTGMTFQAIEHATLEEIKTKLDRARGYGRPITKMHLGVHSSPQGVMLGNKLVDSVQLSRILRGVRILLIAGCDSSQVGDFLGVVPFVVTMHYKVPTEDAARFTRAFWTQIARGVEPGQAVNAALERSPSGMSEYVERHF